MTSSEYLSPHDTDELIHTAVVRGDFVLASGIRSSAKFDFDLIETDSELFRRIALGLSECITDNFTDFDAVLTVANGATRLGGLLSGLLKVPHIESTYEISTNGEKVFTVDPLIEAKNSVIVDDVFTRGTNATKVANASIEHGIETAGVVVVLDRSANPRPRILGDRAVKSLVQLNIE